MAGVFLILSGGLLSVPVFARLPEWPQVSTGYAIVASLILMVGMVDFVRAPKGEQLLGAYLGIWLAGATHLGGAALSLVNGGFVNAGIGAATGAFCIVLATYVRRAF